MSGRRPARTRAAVLREHGRPPVVEDHEPRQPEDGEAIVAVAAAPITPLDVLCASGTSYLGAPALPYVPGVQGVGVVVAGSAVTPGTAVWFPTAAGMAPGDGSLASHAAAAETDLVPLPPGVTPVDAAALGLSAVAAWMALTWRGRLEPGEQVVVLGAGGVVGQVAVQAARLLGARRVVAACRSDPAARRATDAGADAVVRLTTGDVDELARGLADACDGPADLVLDPLFGAPAAAALRVLRPFGRLVHLGASAGATATLDSATLRGRSLAVLGYTNNALTREQRSGALLEVLEHAADGLLRVDHEVVPLDGVAEAWQRQAAGTADRRLVVTLA